MARKKKTTSTVEKEKATKSGMNVGYQGKLTVKINSGKTTISTKTYHNTGTYKMFKFLCDSLAGYDTAKSRPCQIRLFSATGAEKAELPNTWEYNDELVSSPFIAVTSTNISPKSVKDGSGKVITDAAEVTYTFKIPYAFLSKEIYKAALYSTSVSSLKDDKFAYFGFITNDATPVWDPIILEDRSGNYSLIIEWTIIISNLYNAG